MRRGLIGLVSLCLLVWLWEGVSHWGPHWQMLLPAPSRIALRLYSGADRFWVHTLATLREVIGGLALASAAAFPLAWLLVRSGSLRVFLQPLLVVMQSVPIFALAPIMILWFDWSYTAIVFPTALMIFFPLTVSIYKGLADTPKHLLDYFTIHRATEWQQLVKLRLPWAAAHIFSGLRIAAALAGMGAVTGEWAGAQEGLGVLMMESRRGADLESTFAALFCLKAMSLSLYALTILAEGLFQRRSHMTRPSTEGRWALSGAVSTVFAFAVLMTGCQHEPEGTRPLRLMLDWLPNPHHTPIYVGLTKGYFQDEGIALDVLKIQDPSDVFPFLSSGQADVGISYMPYLIQAVAHGAHARAVGYLIKQPLNSFIFPKSLKISQPSDLNGKSVAETPDDMMGRALNHLLSENGIVLAARRKVGFDLTAALAAGKVDAIYNAYWNIEGEQLNSFGLAVDHFLVSDLGMPLYFELIMVAPQPLLERHPGLVRSLQRALQRSIDFCQQNPEEAFAIYQQWHPDKSPTTLAWERSSWQLTWPLLALNQDAESQVWQTFLDWLQCHALLDRQVMVAELVVQATQQ